MDTESVQSIPTSDDYNIENDIKYELLSINEVYTKYYKTVKITKPLLSKYEKAKLLSVRAQQLSEGATAMVIPKYDNVIDIAKQELKERKIPFLIRRYLPDMSYEDWRLEELIF